MPVEPDQWNVSGDEPDATEPAPSIAPFSQTTLNALIQGPFAHIITKYVSATIATNSSKAFDLRFQFPARFFLETERDGTAITMP